MATYIGFSTQNRLRKFKVTDFELVKQDLYNHFHIRKGEKLMNPKFGSIIWDLLFEPFTEEVKNSISEDVQTIASYDPRILVENVIVTEYEHGLQLELELRFVTSNQVSELILKFDRETETLTVA
jgi:phage baseplate assembly protein W